MTTPERHLRLFAAVDISPAVRARAEEVLAAGRKVLPGVRWVSADNLHLTVKFLGDTPPGKVPEVRRALAAAASATGPFGIALRGLGAFPSPRRPRVVFIGVLDGAGELKVLMEAAESALAPLGFPREAREPSPHLTIGRVKTPPAPGAVERWFREREAVDLGSFVAGELALVSSHLSPEGSRYEVVGRYPLGGTGRAGQ